MLKFIIKKKLLKNHEVQNKARTANKSILITHPSIKKQTLSMFRRTASCTKFVANNRIQNFVQDTVIYNKNTKIGILEINLKYQVCGML
jgi:hypothetical protein